MTIPPHIREAQKRDAFEVEKLCERVGYGFVMHEASRLWRERDEFGAKGAHTVGPCVVMTEPCKHWGARKGDHCDWCCGAGWVTKKVARLASKKREGK